MSGMTPDFHEGDKVNVKYNNKWSKHVFTIRHTWWTSEDGRQYQVVENGDTFKEHEVRKAK